MEWIYWVGGMVIVILIVAVFYMFLMFWNAFHTKKLKKNYDDTQDKSKQGEERRFLDGDQPIRKGGNPTEGEHIAEGYVELGRQEVLPPTDVSSVRKNRPRSGNLIRRIRKPR